MAPEPDVAVLRFRLLPGTPVDSLGKAKLSKELLVSLYSDQGLTEEQVAAATGWSRHTIAKRLRAFGIGTRPPGRRSADAGKGPEVGAEESPVLEAQEREIIVEAPDGTSIVLNTPEEVGVFNAVVELYTQSYGDWDAPADRQMVTNLARLQVNIHRLEEDFRKPEGRDPKRLSDMANLMARQAAFHKELGISRPQRDASRDKEAPDAWLQRVLEANRQYDDGKLPEAVP